MRVMNEAELPGAEAMPSPEQRVGQHLRVLRQRRGWSQQEVAERMRAYGYDWSQAIITRLESASRPMRLNEISDLALLFEIPVRELLGFEAPDDLDATDREIAELVTMHTQLQDRLSQAHSRVAGLQEALSEAQQYEAEAAAAMVRVDARIEVLASRHPRYKHLAGSWEGVVNALIRLRNSEREAGGEP
jgi:transcriptional regulator with XRE-family HTH domain